MDLQKSNNNRIEWIDLCKGFAMLLVMFGHTYSSNVINLWIYSFHMPLFFFLSGYVFSIEKYNSFRSFLISKIKTLIIPMVILGFANIFASILNRSTKLDLSLIYKILGIFFQLRCSIFDSVLWFIACLFITEIFMYFIIKISKGNNKMIFAILILLSILGFAYIKFIGIILPWSIEAAFISVGFLGVGYIIKEEKNRWFDRINNKLFILISIVINLFATVMHYMIMGRAVDLFDLSVGVYPLYYIAAFAGIFASIGIFSWIKGLNLLSYVGKNSLIYYALHNLCFTLFQKIGMYFVNDIITGTMYVVLSSVIIALISYFINRYVPWIIGRKRI